MAKKSRLSLDTIKSFVDNTYNRFGNRLLVNVEKPYDPNHSSLGYCYKYVDPSSKNVTYKIDCSKIGIPETDFRIMMHEYGHIYLGHLDGIHEDLDTQICNVFRDYRGELIDYINNSCGIDFADKLIERVIDDPELNHSLHNIAMDMEVNSTILSKDDIEEMEMDISSIYPKYEEEAVKYAIDHENDPEKKKQLEDVLGKMEKEAKIKLILPERYYLGVDDVTNQPIPFPNNLTYAEYLMLIIKHFDQFVKMMVSIQMGGNGDTSQVTQQDIQNALNNLYRNLQGKSEEYKRGYKQAIQDYQNGQVQSNPQPQNGQQGNQNQQNGQQQQSGQSGQQGQQSGQGDPQAGQGGQQSGQGQGQGQSGQGQGGQQSSGQQSGGQSGNQGGQNQSGQGQNGQGQGMSDYQRGYQDALNNIQNAQNSSNGGGMQGLSDLMSDLGMSDSPNSQDGQDQSQNQSQNQQNGSGKKYEGKRFDPLGGDSDFGKDHENTSRQEADRKRELGQIRAGGGTGCGSSGGADATREVNKNVDEVDMALNEVMKNVRNRVIKMNTLKDNMKLYNRGVIRSLVVPSISRKITITNDPKIVYLIDISGSMDTKLVDRILATIGKNMRRLSNGLKYDIITWNTQLGEHIKDVDPKKGVPRISMGGGTSIAKGIKYFKDNYGPEAILIVISDFEDYLEEWNAVESTMNEYAMYGFNYGDGSYGDSDKISWKNMKIRKFKQH